MSQHDTCAFCVKLPVTSHRARKISRCPLCRSMLIETSVGTTCRFAEAIGETRSRRRGYIWVMGGTGLLVAVWLGLQLLHSPPQTLTVAQADPDTTPGRPPPAVTQSPPTVIDEAPRQPAKRAAAPSTQRVAAVAETPKAPARVKDTAHAAIYASGRPKPYAVPQPPELAPAKIDVAESADFTPSPELLRRMLLQVREVRLKDVRPAASLDETRKQILEVVKQIEEKNKKTQDGYIRELMKKRTDLAGLPFLLGKDCELPSDKAARFAELTVVVRRALQNSLPSSQDTRARRPSGGQTPTRMSSGPDAHVFWTAWSRPHGPGRRTADDVNRDDAGQVAALGQLLAPEDENFHRGLVEYLRALHTKPATVALAREALFALDAETRLCATEALRQRPAEDYTPILLDGLRYPWAPVVHHAAQALVGLQRTDLVPWLVERLEGPDPCAPFEIMVDKDKVMAVRELVRINHNRNCLLCHAPTNRGRSGVAGLVPTPGEEPPPPFSTAYYSGSRRSDSIFARADVTYLRQDFSVMQPADDYKAFQWPEMQRFDFLVRTRVLSEDELAEYRARERANAGQPSEHRRALLRALRVLTSQDVGTTAPAWRAVLARDDRSWRSPCLK